MSVPKFRGTRAIVNHVLSYRYAFVGISWVRNVFSWVIYESKFFPRGNFVGPRLFLECISWVQTFFSRVFRGSNFFLRTNFVNQRFSVVDCVRNGERKLKYTKTSQTVYSIPNRFQQLSGLFCIKKGHHLRN